MRLLLLKREKGQAIVEFAFVVPIFIMLLIGLLYVGMMFLDYISLENLARSVAREASLTASSDEDDPYEPLRTRYKATYKGDYLYLYDVKFEDDEKFKIKKVYYDTTGNEVAKSDDATPSVLVAIEAPVNENAASLFGPFRNFLGSDNVLSRMRVEYKMYSDTD